VEPDLYGEQARQEVSRGDRVEEGSGLGRPE
jgi:hypothetical protein